MQKQNLTSASHALFNRRPDERFESLDHLMQHCSEDKRRSIERWHAPSEVSAVAEDGTARSSFRRSSVSLERLEFFTGVQARKRE